MLNHFQIQADVQFEAKIKSGFTVPDPAVAEVADAKAPHGNKRRVDAP